jgi:hypothetical protein
MFLTGLTHRRRLFNVAMRWLTDQPRPEDARAVTDIFVYEGLVAVAEARHFMAEVYRGAFGPTLGAQRIVYKHELRELALEAIGTPTPRQYEMMEAYHANPEAYFRRMPIDGEMYFGGEGQLVGGYRIKRPRRVAEKASRRLADHLGGLIRTRAEELAAHRASREGRAMGELRPSPGEEEREFIEAEAWLSDRFRDGTMRLPTEAMHIDDLVGFKVIGSPEELERAEQVIAAHPKTTIYERELHSGAYNAVNLLVDLELPTDDEIVGRHRSLDWSFAAGRGLTTEQLAAGLPTFVEGSADTIRIELILTSFDEFLESELGRCIHEYRVLEQRARRDYRGRMAKNAEFIIEFLLAVAFSPTVEIDEIPVKMWGQYLPETLSNATRRLLGVEQSGLISPGHVGD